MVRIDYVLGYWEENINGKILRVKDMIFLFGFQNMVSFYWGFKEVIGEIFFEFKEK